MYVVTGKWMKLSDGTYLGEVEDLHSIILQESKIELFKVMQNQINTMHDYEQKSITSMRKIFNREGNGNKYKYHTFIIGDK